MNYADITRSLTRSLDLTRPPIAVCLADSVPDGVTRIEKIVPAGCQFWQQAATRTFATVTADHELCAIGVYTHNLSSPSQTCKAELKELLGVLDSMTYVRERDVAQVPVRNASPGCVVYGPLAETPLPPEVVLLFADSRQGLFVTEAVQQLEAGLLPALGRPACAIIAQAVNSGRAALSLGCCGARAYVDALSDDVALWALPGSRLAEYAERISALATANRVLGTFHVLRRQDVESGKRPSLAESLGRLQAHAEPDVT